MFDISKNLNFWESHFLRISVLNTVLCKESQGGNSNCVVVDCKVCCMIRLSELAQPAPCTDSPQHNIVQHMWRNEFWEERAWLTERARFCDILDEGHFKTLKAARQNSGKNWINNFQSPAAVCRPGSSERNGEIIIIIKCLAIPAAPRFQHSPRTVQLEIFTH